MSIKEEMKTKEILIDKVESVEEIIEDTAEKTAERTEEVIEKTGVVIDKTVEDLEAENEKLRRELELMKEKTVKERIYDHVNVSVRTMDIFIGIMVALFFIVVVLGLLNK